MTIERSWQPVEDNVGVDDREGRKGAKSGYLSPQLFVSADKWKVKTNSRVLKGEGGDG
jgi:hypothetical protein